jgi:hypothetical protein
MTHYIGDRVDDTGRYGGVLVIAAFFVLGTCAWLMSAGFCFSQARYLTEHELIVSAIRSNASRMHLDGIEASAEAFVAANPKCCDVDRYPAARSLLDVVTGFNISEVSVTYRNPYLGQAALEPFYRSYIAVEACGKAIKKVRGTGLTRPF